MRSDEITMPTPEFITNNECGTRLLAYSHAISRKDGKALENKATGGSGISGLRKELEKTKLDV